MSATANLFDQRVAYRPEVVNLFRNLTEPEIHRVNEELTKLQNQVNSLVAKIADGERYIAELRQAQKDVEASADLPGAQPPLSNQGDAQQHAEMFGGPQTGTRMPPLCPCGEPMELDEKRGLIHRVEGGWEVAGENCHRAAGTKVLPPIEAVS